MLAVKVKLLKNVDIVHPPTVNVRFFCTLYITAYRTLASQQDKAAWLTFKIVHQN